MFLIYGLVVFFLTACGTTNGVFTDYNPTTDFTNYTTYNIAKPKAELQADANPIAHQRIERAIKKEMALLNYQLAAQPDLIVSFFTKVEDIVEREYYTTYYNGGARIPVVGPELYQYEKGSIIINIIDTKTNEAVWHGVIEGRVRTNTKTAEEDIQKAVRAIIQEYANNQLHKPVALN